MKILNTLDGASKILEDSTHRFITDTERTTWNNNSLPAGFGPGAGTNAIVEGTLTEANGNYSHAEGNNTTAVGSGSHAEGANTIANGHFSHAEGNGVAANGQGSHAEGNLTVASGIYSHVEGNSSLAKGSFSHAEGTGTQSLGIDAHTEGNYTTAVTDISHAEGKYTLACSGTIYKITSYNDINKTITLDKVTSLAVNDILYIKITGQSAEIDVSITAINSLTVTLNTTATLTANWKYAIEKSSIHYPTHAEGINTIASGTYTHAEGENTVASGNYGAHAEGTFTLAQGEGSHAEGNETSALGSYSHAEGNLTTSSGSDSHAEGYFTAANGNRSHAEGDSTETYGSAAHAEGYMTVANGQYSHSEGSTTTANGIYSHTEGYMTVSSTSSGHAEGRSTLSCHGTIYTITAFDDTAKTITLNDVTGLIVGDLLQIKVLDSYTQIDIPITVINGLIVTLNTTMTLSTSWKAAIKIAATQYPTHAEGMNTIASGKYSHSQNANTIASGDYAHAEGNYSEASGMNSHAQGSYTTALGNYAHAQNRYTIAQGYGQTAIGKYNVAQGTVDSTSVNDFAFIIGNGGTTSTRSNALTVDWNGVMQFSGIPTILQSSSYTLGLADRGTLQKCLSASAIVVTIPLNTTTAFPINTEIIIARYGAGAVSIAPISGVTLYSSDSKKSVNKQYEAVTLKKIATNEWLLIGSLSA